MFKGGFKRIVMIKKMNNYINSHQRSEDSLQVSVCCIESVQGVFLRATFSKMFEIAAKCEVATSVSTHLDGTVSKVTEVGS